MYIRYQVRTHFGSKGAKKTVSRATDRRDPFHHLLLKLAGFKSNTKKASPQQQFMRESYNTELPDPDNPSTFTTMRDKVHSAWSTQQAVKAASEEPQLRLTPMPTDFELDPLWLRMDGTQRREESTAGGADSGAHAGHQRLL